jgi:hypothetical protein
VVKGEVCKTSMQRFESARRLQFLILKLCAFSKKRRSLIARNTHVCTSAKSLISSLAVNSFRIIAAANEIVYEPVSVPSPIAGIFILVAACFAHGCAD